MSFVLGIKIQQGSDIAEEELHEEIDKRIEGKEILILMFKKGYCWDEGKQCYTMQR